MVRTISGERGKARALTSSFGKQLLEIITAGMYSDPCMALREYVQNGADSLDEAIDKKLITYSESKIEIKLDGKNRNLVIEDNGVGVSNKLLEKKLGSLGQSNKEGTGLRGFRGIGRLGGLSYCDQLVFETRTVGDKKVGVVQWDGSLLRDSIATKGIKSLSEIISKIARISFRNPTKEDSKHFFRVTLSNINSFHTDRLTSIDTIVEYLARIAPLPFDTNKFSWAGQIDQYLADVPGHRSYNIYVNGKKVFNTYQDKFNFTKSKADKISQIDLVEFCSSDGKRFGKGWIARTSFLGGLPRSVTMRGISIRQGNIEICNDDFLAGFFTEARFAAWHIGAIHLDYTLRPNARRDGFEETENYEKFLEQLTVLGIKMSRACRSASVKRYSNEDLERSLALIERFLRGSTFIDKEHFQDTFKKVNQLIVDLEANKQKKDYPLLEKRLSALRKQLTKKNKKIYYISDLIDRRQIKQVHQTELLELTCRAILRNIKHDGLSKKILSEVLTPFMKNKRYRNDLALLS